MHILVISSIMPAPLSSKQRENDVLFTTADMHEKYNNDVTYTFLYVVPYSNFLLSLISKKWKEYRGLRKKGTFDYQNRKVEVISMPGFRNDSFFKRAFVNISFYFYKRKIRRIIIGNAINLIHAHNISADAGLANTVSNSFKIPYVVTTRNIHNNKITSYVKRNLSKASALISLNHNLKTISDKYNARSVIIPHGIDKRFFEVSCDISETGVLRIVSICRLLDWKNIDKVLYALENANFDFIYEIYGDGPDKERLTSTLEKLTIKKKVKFKGFVDYHEVPGVLSNYDLFVLISYPETFGRIFIESMAVGLPIVAARGCGMDGFLSENKEGFLVSHLNTDELTALLDELNYERNLLKRASSEARQLAKSFSWERIVKSIDDLYKRV